MPNTEGAPPTKPVQPDKNSDWDELTSSEFWFVILFVLAKIQQKPYILSS